MSFEGCREKSAADKIEGAKVRYLGKEDIISAKQLAGRPEDLVDIRNLKMRE